MSEYIEIETEMSDDGAKMRFCTNLKLTDATEGEEQYLSAAEMEEGSPVAQALAVVEGMAAVHIDGRDLLITREPDADWHVIVADVTAVLKDFFL
jgi:hypothetical protein